LAIQTVTPASNPLYSFICCAAGYLHTTQLYLSAATIEDGRNVVAHFEPIEESKMPKVNLTQKFIDKNLICPEGKRKIEFCDTQVDSFRVDVTYTSPGKGTYYYSRKIDGKRSHIKISRTGDMTLQDAREFARNLRADYQLGGDPYSAIKAKKNIITWNQYMKTTYIPHIKAHLRSWKGLVQLNEKYLKPEIGHMPLNKITLGAAQKLHRDMVEIHQKAPASADLMAKLLRQALNYAVRLDIIDSSPVSKIQLFLVSNFEERVLSNAQLKALMEALESDKNRTVCLVVKFLLFTGARVSEALHARWADIDRKNRTWTIQATNSKSKKRRSVPLSDAAIAVLDQLKSEGQSEWLFNSSRGGRLSHITKVWARIRREAGLEGTLDGGLNFRLHDARHAAASAMVSSGQSLYTVQKILGHSDPSVTQRYAHISTDALQDAANCISTYVDNALENADD
jgi:integrase